MDLQPLVTGPGQTFLQSLQLPSNIANTQANTTLEQAQAAGVGAQTQSTNLANQLTQLKLSGMTPLLQSLNAPTGTPSAPGEGTAPSSGSASSGGGGATDPGEAAVFQQFAPIPTARPAQVAQKVAAATILYGPEAGNAIGAQYDAQVAGINQNRQLAANNAYQAAATVESAPPGQAKAVLERINPQLASALEAKYANDTPDKMDADLRGYARTFGLNAYQYSGRPSRVDNGVLVDDKSGAPVVGAQQLMTGLDANGKNAAMGRATDVVTVKNSDGSESQIQRWKYEGYTSAGAYVIAADKAARSSSAAPAAEPATGAPAAGTAPGGVPAAAPAPGGAPGGPLVSSAAAPASAPATASAPSRPQAAPAQQAPKDNGLLPGVDVSALPKPALPPVVVGRSQTPADAITANGIATERQAQLKDSNTQYGEAQKEQALINAAQAEAARLSSNPRLAGPGSEAAKAWAQVKTFVSGQPPDAYVDLGSLDKLLLQMGAQNIRQALSGQRITNQEFMTLMTKGNPNTEQPLPTINKLLGYLGAQNDYDMRFQRTKQAALNSGANPMTVDTDIGGKANRSDYVAQRTGIRPPAQSSPAAAAGAPDAGGFIPGKQYKDKNGNTATYVGNGKWQ